MIRRSTLARLEDQSWPWWASFMLPGVFRTMTDVMADGLKTAVFGFPSATPGIDVGAWQKQGSARLASPTR